MNTYNKDNVLRDFNTLLDLYLNSSSEEKKINIYSQMLFIYNIEPKLVKIVNYLVINQVIIVFTQEKENQQEKKDI